MLQDACRALGIIRKVDVTESGSGGQAVPVEMRAVIGLQPGVIRFRRGSQILQQELHLLDDASAHDLVIFIQPELESFAQQDLVVNIPVDQFLQRGSIRLRSVLQRVLTGQACRPLRCQHDPVGVGLLLVNPANQESRDPPGRSGAAAPGASRGVPPFQGYFNPVPIAYSGCFVSAGTSGFCCTTSAMEEGSWKPALRVRPTREDIQQCAIRYTEITDDRTSLVADVGQNGWAIEKNHGHGGHPGADCLQLLVLGISLCKRKTSFVLTGAEEKAGMQRLVWSCEAHWQSRRGRDPAPRSDCVCRLRLHGFRRGTLSCCRSGAAVGARFAGAPPNNIGRPKPHPQMRYCQQLGAQRRDRSKDSNRPCWNLE